MHNEDLKAEFLLKAGGETLRLVNRWRLPDEDPIKGGIAGASDELRGSVFTGELRPQVFGILMDRVGADLDGIEVAHYHGRVWCGRELGGDDIGIGMRRADDLQADRANARPQQLNLAGGGFREIDDAPVDEGSAVGDAHIDGEAIRQIRDAHPGIEGHGAVRGGHLFHVVDFAVSRLTPVIRRPIPTGKTFFRRAGRRRDGRCSMRARSRRRSGSGCNFGLVPTSAKHERDEGRRQRDGTDSRKMHRCG